ncbi:MAG: TetR/AcrR family transcriptional regulator [Chitinophagales bacterium]
MKKKPDNRETDILKAAAKVFSEKGYAGATTKEIAQEAEISEGTIFRYFPTKKYLLEQILQRMADEFVPQFIIGSLESTLEESKSKSPEEIFRSAFRSRLNLVKDNSNFFRVIWGELWFHSDLWTFYKEKLMNPIRGIIERYLREGIEAGMLRQVDVPVATWVIMGIFATLFIRQQEHLGDSDNDFDAQIDIDIDSIIDILFNGVRKEQ